MGVRQVRSRCPGTELWGTPVETVGGAKSVRGDEVGTGGGPSVVEAV